MPGQNIYMLNYLHAIDRMVDHLMTLINLQMRELQARRLAASSSAFLARRQYLAR